MGNPTKVVSVFSDGKVSVRGGLPIPTISQKLVTGDLGYTIPDDGNLYVMPQHEIIFLGKTRHNDNKPNDTEPRPAVVNASWGIRTLAVANGDYSPIQDPWQIWFSEFWESASGIDLPEGKFEGTYVNPKNPNIIYSKYTPGSKLALYAGMIMDAKSHTDSASPETGARDVVTGRNLLSKTPWAWLCRITTGALLQVERREGSRLRIRALNLNLPPPNLDILEPWQWYYGTQVDRFGNVTRYPDIKNIREVHNLPPAGTAMPLVAPGGYFYIDRVACVELLPGQVWKPYYTHKL